MASPLVCLFVTFGESHSRMLIDWATGEQNPQSPGGPVVNEQGKELSVRLLRIILAISSVPAQFPIEVAYILTINAIYTIYTIKFSYVDEKFGVCY